MCKMLSFKAYRTGRDAEPSVFLINYQLPVTINRLDRPTIFNHLHVYGTRQKVIITIINSINCKCIYCKPKIEDM